MRFTLLAVAALSFVSTGLATPYIHCGGQDLCSTMQKKFCDITVNDKIIRNDEINYGSPQSDIDRDGSCTSNLAKLGCGVFIRGGPDCKFSGNKIWNDYQEITKCGKCGSKIYDDGCEVAVDYISECEH